MLDPTTFGKSKACLVLVDLINQKLISQRKERKLLCLINRAALEFKLISNIPDSRAPSKIMDLVRCDFLNKIDRLGLPLKMSTFTKNVITYHADKNLKKIEFY